VRILVVEDDPLLAEGLVRVLTHANHAVDHEASGKRADLALRNTEFDLVVLDIGLPDMDGYALAAAMRRAARGPLRLAALTGYGRQAGVVAHMPADAAAFDLHLTKPASMEDLRRALEVDEPVGLSGTAPA